MCVCVCVCQIVPSGECLLGKWIVSLTVLTVLQCLYDVARKNSENWIYTCCVCLWLWLSCLSACPCIYTLARSLLARALALSETSNIFRHFRQASLPQLLQIHGYSFLYDDEETSKHHAWENPKWGDIILIKQFFFGIHRKSTYQHQNGTILLFTRRTMSAILFYSHLLCRVARKLLLNSHYFPDVSESTQKLLNYPPPLSISVPKTEAVLKNLPRVYELWPIFNSVPCPGSQRKENKACPQRAREEQRQEQRRAQTVRPCFEKNWKRACVYWYDYTSAPILRHARTHARTHARARAHTHTHTHTGKCGEIFCSPHCMQVCVCVCVCVCVLLRRERISQKECSVRVCVRASVSASVLTKFRS